MMGLLMCFTRYLSDFAAIHKWSMRLLEMIFRLKD